MKKLYARLNPKVQNYSYAGSGTHDALTPEILAGAMGSITEPCGDLLLRVKYAGQMNYAPKLSKLFSDHLLAQFNKKGWLFREEKTVNLLASSVLYEDVCQRCTYCNGMGEVMKNEGKGLSRTIEVCPRCEGSCKWKVVKAERYRAIGVDNKSYATTWEERYEFAMDELHRIEGFSNASVMRALK